MASVNKVTIVGRVGKDPEHKATDRGEVCKLSVATSESWKDKVTGERSEKTEWHNIVAFGKVASLIASYVVKGDLIYIEGKLQTRTWDDKTTGKKMYTTEIVAGSVQFLSTKKQQNTENGKTVQGPSWDDNADIPF